MSLLRLELPAEPTAVAHAREAVDVLRPQVGEQRLLDLRLLVSEVVTNAVRHARDAGEGASVVLIADAGPDFVRIEVHDQGDGFVAPDVPAPRAEGTSGWGLFLVEKLSRRWGTQPAPDAHVWFELATG